MENCNLKWQDGNVAPMIQMLGGELTEYDYVAWWVFERDPDFELYLEFKQSDNELHLASELDAIDLLNN